MRPQRTRSRKRWRCWHDGGDPLRLLDVRPGDVVRAAWAQLDLIPPESPAAAPAGATSDSDRKDVR